MEITKEQAEQQLLNYGHSLPFSILCKEYKTEQSEEWSEVVPGNLKKDKLPHWMQTFKIKWHNGEIKGWF